MTQSEHWYLKYKKITDLVTTIISICQNTA